MIEKVVAYKTSDGQMFDDFQKARKWETRMRQREWAQEFANDFFFHGMNEGDLIQGLMDWYDLGRLRMTGGKGDDKQEVEGAGALSGDDEGTSSLL